MYFEMFIIDAVRGIENWATWHIKSIGL